jgi:hypothetical protein
LSEVFSAFPLLLALLGIAFAALCFPPWARGDFIFAPGARLARGRNPHSTEEAMFGSNAFLTGLGIGAGCMYFFDPDLGRRRRTLFSDQWNRACRDLENAADVTLRDLNNRLTGLAAMSRAQERDDSDPVLVNRVRSKMGRYVSHPSAIRVTAKDGRVRLSGPVLAREVEALFAAVRAVPGVAHVENNLDAHQSAEGIAALQGGRTPTGEPWEFMQQNWSPTMRLAAGTAAALALGSLATTRTSGPLLFGALGLCLLGWSQTAGSSGQPAQARSRLQFPSPRPSAEQFTR